MAYSFCRYVLLFEGYRRTNPPFTFVLFTRLIILIYTMYVTVVIKMAMCEGTSALLRILCYFYTWLTGIHLHMLSKMERATQYRR